MNKGQFEIVGLAILVLVITLGGLIFFVLNQGHREENAIKQYSNTEFAQGYIEVLLRTTADQCKGYTVNELLKDCASDEAITCEDNAKACGKAEDAAKAALDKTLKEYNKKYSFTVEFNNPSKKITIQSGQQGQYSCAEKERPGRQPLPNNVLLTLEICG